MVQALLCGAAVLALLPGFAGGSQATLSVARAALALNLVLHLGIVGAEFLMPHSTDNAAYAARLITDGPFGAYFWLGTISLGGIMPLGLLVLSSTWSIMLSAVLSLAGVLVFEWCFVMAGQSVPNS